MIGHHDPANQFIEALVLSGEQDADYGTSNILLDQPLRSGCSRIQDLIEGQEFRSLGSPTVRDVFNRKRAGQTPRQEA
jgi:hypothetical protein